MAVCPNCGNQSGEGAIFCDQCGTRLPKPEVAAPPAAAPVAGSVICAACGAGNVPGEAFCDFCGAPLEAPLPAAEAAPVAAGVEEAVSVPPAEQPLTCPACGAKVLPGEAFCADCGASLAQPPIPPEPVAEIPVPEAGPAPAPAVEAEAAAAPVAEAVPAVPVPIAEPVAPAAPVCPACGAVLEPGDKFCSNCGAAQAAAPPPVPAVEPAIVLPEPIAVPAAPPAGPRLVVVATGAEIPLPLKDELLIGREDPVSGIFPDIDLTPHGGEEGGVSRRHARLTLEGATYSIEDLNSTNFTFVSKQKLAPGTRQTLKDGDEIRCGRVALVFKSGG